MEEITKDWEKVKLEEITDIINGFAFKSKDFVNSGTPLVKIKELKDERITLENCSYLPTNFDVKSRYRIKYDDILIALTGSHITLPSSAVGRVAKSKYNSELLLNQRVGKFKIYENKCNADFLYYFLISESFFENIGLLSRGAANQANISTKDVKSISINLPPLATQQKIASVLSAYDDLIENNLKRIEVLEEMAQQTYEEWFVRMKYPGHESDQLNSETGLPEGWEEVKLSDTAIFLNGFAFKPKDFQKEGYPIVKIREMRNGISNDTPLNNGDRVDDKYIINSGDILFSWSATLDAIIWRLGKGYVNQHLFKVTPKKGFNRSFVFYSVKNSIKIFNSLTTGATMKHIKRKELDFVKVNKPTKEIFSLFDEKVGSILHSIQLFENQNQHLREARDLLLPRLMMGLIDVEEILVSDEVYSENGSIK